MRVAFIGHQKWGCLALDALLGSLHEVAGVIAEPDEFYAREAAYARRFERLGLYASLKDFAREKGLEAFQPQDINAPASLERITSWRPDLTVILNYHSIIRGELLSRHPIINTHGALLPEYRGRSSVNWAIINGERETGVTVHYIDEKVDTGDIITRERVPIGTDDGVADVLRRMLPLYPKAVLRAVDSIEAGTAERVKQDPSRAAYYRARKPEDGAMDWGWDSVRLHNWVRALGDPFPGAFTQYGGRRLVVWKASLASPREATGLPPGFVMGHACGKAEVATADASIFFERVQLEGSGEEEAAACLEPGETLGQ